MTMSIKIERVSEWQGMETCCRRFTNSFDLRALAKVSPVLPNSAILEPCAMACTLMIVRRADQ